MILMMMTTTTIRSTIRRTHPPLVVIGVGIGIGSGVIPVRTMGDEAVVSSVVIGTIIIVASNAMIAVAAATATATEEMLMVMSAAGTCRRDIQLGCRMLNNSARQMPR
jgi:hypothetical protein